jgi:HEAT repeat protein
MLNDLDAVPWRAMRHALGAATDVPRLIRALVSADREERQTALKELFACLLHQGTVYEATALAVPFLFELLANPSTPERNWIAFLLASIANGQGYLKVHTSLDEQRWRKILVERGTTLEAELQREEQIVNSVQLEVGRAVRLLVPHLSDGQSEIRAAVARALGRQTARAQELIPVLEAAEAAETATDARDAVRLSLARLRSLGSE